MYFSFPRGTCMRDSMKPETAEQRGPDVEQQRDARAGISSDIFPEIQRQRQTWYAWWIRRRSPEDASQIAPESSANPVSVLLSLAPLVCLAASFLMQAECIPRNFDSDVMISSHSAGARVRASLPDPPAHLHPVSPIVSLSAGIS